MILSYQGCLNQIGIHQYEVPDVIAWLEEMQACVTVWAGVLSENPALNIAWKASRRCQ